MSRVEIITTKIKALWALKERKAWPKDPDVAGEVIRQYVKALSSVPDKELPAVLDYFFSEETTSMPQPAALSAFWWRQSAPQQEKKPDELTWANVMGAGLSPYAKSLIGLIFRRFGRPSQKKDKHGKLSDVVIRHSLLTPEQFTLELKKLGDKHKVPWIGSI